LIFILNLCRIGFKCQLGGDEGIPKNLVIIYDDIPAVPLEWLYPVFRTYA